MPDPQDATLPAMGAETYVQRIQRQLVASTQLCNTLLHEQISMAQLLSSVAGGDQASIPRDRLSHSAAMSAPPTPSAPYFMSPWHYPYWYAPPPWVAPGGPAYPQYPGAAFPASPAQSAPVSSRSATVPPTAAFDRAMGEQSRSARVAAPPASLPTEMIFPFVRSSVPPKFTGAKPASSATSASSLSRSAPGLADLSHRGMNSLHCLPFRVVFQKAGEVCLWCLI